MNQSKTTPFGLPVSALVLIGVNLIPLCGVLFAGWDVFGIVLLYWIETAVIGAVNVLRILTAGGDLRAAGMRMLEARKAKASPEQIRELEEKLAMAPSGQLVGHSLKLFMVPFFCVHFGIFMTVHLMFILTLLGSKNRGFSGGSPFDALGRVGEMLTPAMWLAVIGLCVSHLFSFFVNYIGKGEFRETTPPEQMMRPYGRVVVMHLAILFGAFATLALGSNLGILLLLVIGKIVIDLTLHLRDHRKMQNKVDRASEPEATRL